MTRSHEIVRIENPDGRLLTADELADYLHLTVGHLSQLRYLGTGPRFVRVTGRQVRYRVSDVDAWLAAKTCTRSDERPQADG